MAKIFPIDACYCGTYLTGQHLWKGKIILDKCLL